MLDMIYSNRDEDGKVRRESLTNIQDIASRISRLQDKENVDNNNKRLPIELNAEASVKVGSFLISIRVTLVAFFLSTKRYMYKF